MRMQLSSFTHFFFFHSFFFFWFVFKLVSVVFCLFVLLYQTKRENKDHILEFCFFFCRFSFHLRFCNGNDVVQHAIGFLCIHSNTDIHIFGFSLFLHWTFYSACIFIRFLFFSLFFLFFSSTFLFKSHLILFCRCLLLELYSIPSKFYFFQKMNSKYTWYMHLYPKYLLENCWISAQFCHNNMINH